MKTSKTFQTWLFWISLVAAVLLNAFSSGAQETVSDTIRTPPKTRIFYSPTVDYKAVIKWWEDLRSDGEKMIRVALHKWETKTYEENRRKTWIKKWSHEIGAWPGPRFVLVGDHGHVIFIDRWGYNRLVGRKMYAILIYGPAGERLDLKYLKDLTDVAGCSRDEAFNEAQDWGWIAQTPNWRAPMTAGIYICGKTLELSLDPVQLRRVDR